MEFQTEVTRQYTHLLNLLVTNGEALHIDDFDLSIAKTVAIRKLVEHGFVTWNWVYLTWTGKTV